MLQLAGVAQHANQAADDIVELDEGILIGMLGRRRPEKALMRVVVEVGPAGAVVEEPGPAVGCHAAQKSAE